MWDLDRDGAKSSSYLPSPKVHVKSNNRRVPSEKPANKKWPLGVIFKEVPAKKKEVLVTMFIGGKFGHQTQLLTFFVDLEIESAIF